MTTTVAPAQRSNERSRPVGVCSGQRASPAKVEEKRGEVPSSEATRCAPQTPPKSSTGQRRGGRTVTSRRAPTASEGRNPVLIAALTDGCTVHGAEAVVGGPGTITSTRRSTTSGGGGAGGGDGCSAASGSIINATASATSDLSCAQSNSTLVSSRVPSTAPEAP